MPQINSVQQTYTARPTTLTDLGGPLAILESDATVWWQVNDFNKHHDAYLRTLPPPLFEDEVRARYKEIMLNKLWRDYRWQTWPV